MTNEEIIRYHMQRSKDTSVSADEMLADLAESLQEGEEQLIRQGNSLFVYNTDDEGSLEFHAFNAEAPEVFNNNLLKFFEFAKLMGFEKAVTSYTNPKINKVFEFVEKTYPVEIFSSPQDDEIEVEVTLQ